MNRHSPDWLALKALILAEIEQQREILEMVGIEPDPIRGRIAALRWVIRAVEPEAPITEPTGTDYLEDTNYTPDADPS